MSDFMDEFFRRLERRFKELEEAVKREIETTFRESRLESARKPFFAESMESLYTVRDVSDRVIVYVDLPYATDSKVV